MNIRCPECRTVFRVDPARIPPAGVRARCSRCSTTFHVTRDAAAEQPTAAPPMPAAEHATAAPPMPAAAAAEAVQAAAAAAVETARSVASGIAEAVAGRAAPDAGSTEPSAQEATAPPRQPTDETPASDPAGAVVEPPPQTAPPAAAAPQQPEPPRAAVGPPPEAAPPAAAAQQQPPPADRQDAVHSQPQLFGTRDPDARAQRIARALISDIVAYHPQRREEAIANGTLRTDFRDEIMKSWEEYVAQVGLETARSTPHFRNALNQILALGQPVF
jgi:predicted Zn finger-like uncharacterized protein